MNKVRTIDELQQEILAVTTKIQKEFPEVYNVLPETPQAPGREDEVGTHEYEQYLEALKKQLEDCRHNTIMINRKASENTGDADSTSNNPNNENARPNNETPFDGVENRV